MNAPLPINALAEVQALSLPDESSLSAGANSALRMAQMFAIADADDYALAADELKAVKAKHKALEERRLSITGPMNKALQAVNDLFRGPLAALKSAEGLFKASMLAYDHEQERIAAEARRVAEEAAAAERRRLEAEAEAVRAAAAEKQRLADLEAKRIADAAKAEQDRLAAEAAAAAAAGNRAAAEQAEREAAAARAKAEAEAAEAHRKSAEAAQAAALEVAAIQSVSSVIVAAPAIAPAAKVAGISTAKSYDFELTDLLSVVKHVAAHPELISLLRLDETKTRALVRGLGANTNVPGIRVFQKSTLRAA